MVDGLNPWLNNGADETTLLFVVYATCAASNVPHLILQHDN